MNAVSFVFALGLLAWTAGALGWLFTASHSQRVTAVAVIAIGAVMMIAALYLSYLAAVQ